MARDHSRSNPRAPGEPRTRPSITIETPLPSAAPSSATLNMNFGNTSNATLANEGGQNTPSPSKPTSRAPSRQTSVEQGLRDSSSRGPIHKSSSVGSNMTLQGEGRGPTPKGSGLFDSQHRFPRHKASEGTLVGADGRAASVKPSIASRRTNRSRHSVATSVFDAPLPWMRRRIQPQHSIYILYTLSFLSAALDAASFTAWTAFLNMQTGNTVFLALGASGQPANNPYAWVTALGSIFMFIIGSILFGQLAKFFGPRTRMSLATSTFLQACCTLIAAVLIQTEIVPVPEGLLSAEDVLNSEPEPRELGAIMPLAFAAAGQVCSTRELGFPLIPTLVLTTIYADAFRDTKLLKKGKQKSDNLMRSKMLWTILFFVLGAIAGGWIARSNVGMRAVVWLAVGWRFGVAVVWVWWPWDEGPNDDEWDSDLEGDEAMVAEHQRRVQADVDAREEEEKEKERNERRRVRSEREKEERERGRSTTGADSSSNRLRRDIQWVENRQPSMVSEHREAEEEHPSPRATHFSDKEKRQMSGGGAAEEAAVVAAAAVSEPEKVVVRGPEPSGFDRDIEAQRPMR